MNTTKQNDQPSHRAEAPEVVGAANAVTPQQPEAKALWPQWAIVVLLSIFIALSGAELLGTVLLELFVDYKAALLRIVILLPVLIIASILLVKQWKKLISEKFKLADESAEKK